MNDPNKILQRLFQAARRAPADPAPRMPFGFDHRVLAQWRAISTGDNPLAWSRQLRWALICALLIMTSSILLGLKIQQTGEPHELSMADSVIRLTLLNE